MSNRLETLLERMPRHFPREPTSNNYKLLSIIAENGVENLAIQQTILRFWDVGTAAGVGLDRLGKDEGISRGGWNDEEYRKMIKIQCIINLSEGDIPTMNLILDAYMEDDFIGFQDAFHTVFEEPAAIVGHVKVNAPSPPTSLIQRLKSAGVRLYWMRTFDIQNLILTHFTYHYPIYYHKCGELITYPIHGLGIGTIIGLPDLQYRYPVYYNPSDTFNTAPTPGANLSGVVSLAEHQYDYPNYYKPSDTFDTHGIQGMQVKGALDAQSSYYRYPNYYPVTNVVESENFLKGAFTEAKTNLQQTTASMRMMAPICGNFTGGGM